MQFVFQVEQSFLFAFEQFRHGNVRPAADDGGDILLADFLLDEPIACLAGRLVPPRP